MEIPDLPYTDMFYIIPSFPSTAIAAQIAAAARTHICSRGLTSLG